MLKALIYSTRTCPYCDRAKALLSEKNIFYEEVRIDESPGERETMLTKSGGRRTVPQIFINARHIGGFDDLHALEISGDLDKWIAKGDV